MSKVSMAEAAKLFDVSRPTLSKHRKDGKISADHILVNGAKVWQFDMAELKRMYQRREAVLHPLPPTAPPASPAYIPADLAALPADPGTELHAEIRVLQAELKAEREARALVQSHLDDLRRMLPGPEAKPTRRGWWPF